MPYNKLKHNTKLPESYHQAFLKELGINEIITKDFFLKRQKFNDILKNRKRYLNEQFNFSKANILKFEKLSAKLTLLQNEIIAKHIYITQKTTSELIENGGQFTDVEISLSIQFMCNLLDGVGSIYESSNIFFSDFTDMENLDHMNKDYADIDNLSDTKKRFSHFYQSRLFHHLLIESPLALQDILLIDRIWFDIKVEYQTCYLLK